MKEFAHPDQAHKTLADLNQAIRSTLVIAHNEYKYVAELGTQFGDLPPIPCFLGEINQVVLNLLVNASHAISDVVKGTGTLGKLNVRTRLDGNEVEISISDTGTGIPESARDKIFDPFFTTKEVGKGTGQGLAIAHSVIVKKHGGTLRFETECGKGTTFLIRLPINVPIGMSDTKQLAA
jgi:signal transduction histidine kinase